MLGAPYARLFAWGLRTFSRPPYGVIWQLEAEGVPAPGGPAAIGGPVAPVGDPSGGSGATATVGLRLLHEDGYWLTSAAAAASLLQYLDGSLREPGVHLQALAVEPVRMLRDLQRMGVRIESRGLDAGALLGR
jgi:saccharopine dehydrogenase (NAD+, L-lysine-forming)